MTIIENRVKILSATCFGNIDTSPMYYAMLFVEMSAIGIFNIDMSKRTKMELPNIIIRLKDFINDYFRIPKRLLDISFEFDDENKAMVLKFQDETVKNEFGDKIKKLTKNRQSLESGVAQHYTDVELKYMIAKTLENMHFKNFKDNYDYRKYLDFTYLSKYSQIYNKKSEAYAYLCNRFFIGKVSV